MRLCIHCDEEFDMQPKVFANHVRWCPSNKTNGDKGRSKIGKATTRANKIALGAFKEYDVVCHKCGTSVVVKEREKSFPKKDKYFCSVSCANSRKLSNEAKKKIGRSVQHKWATDVEYRARCVMSSKKTEPLSDETRQKISESVKKKWATDPVFADRCKASARRVGERRRADPVYAEKWLKHLPFNKGFTSKNEVLIREHIINKFPNDEWTFGGNLAHNGERVSRDLYSPLLKICFEYDGIWHFEDIHGQLESKQRKDNALASWCIENDWRLIRMSENFFIEEGADKAFALLEKCFYTSTKKQIVKYGEEYS